jgi:hypothetical protein
MSDRSLAGSFRCSNPLLSLTRALGREQTELLKAEWGTRRGGPTHDDSGAGLASTSAGARALFCTLAGLTYRQLRVFKLFARPFCPELGKGGYQ